MSPSYTNELLIAKNALDADKILTTIKEATDRSVRLLGRGALSGLLATPDSTH